MIALSRSLARLLPLLTLLSPVAQIHMDHLSGDMRVQSLLSVVMIENEEAHAEALPHEDATTEECPEHPTVIQAIAVCHGGSQTHVQVEGIFTSSILVARTRNDSDISPDTGVPQHASTHKPILFLRV